MQHQHNQVPSCLPSESTRRVHATIKNSSDTAALSAVHTTGHPIESHEHHVGLGYTARPPQCHEVTNRQQQTMLSKVLG